MREYTMKVVGITGSIARDEETNYLNLSYTNTFTNNKVISVIIPSVALPKEAIEYIDPNWEEFVDKWAQKIVSRLDALVLSGGADMNPLVTYNEFFNGSMNPNYHRDYSEIALVKAALEKKIPIMGICRGFQLLGHILEIPKWQQDLKETHSSNAYGIDTRVEPTHLVDLFGRFKVWADRDYMTVNSFHHQGFEYDKKVEYGDVSILATCGKVLEAFEHQEKKIYAVQWHPEEFGATSLSIQYFLSQYLEV